MTDAKLVECGWGRVLFAPHYEKSQEIAAELANELRGQRDIATYLRRPQVVLSYAPQHLFLDPSDMLRLDLEAFEEQGTEGDGLEIRRLKHRDEAESINILYLKRDMVPTDPDFVWHKRNANDVIYLVAVDPKDGSVYGSVMGIDHVKAFDDSAQGSSLWCLTVDPAAPYPGIGQALVISLANHFKKLGRRTMDLSVIHDNEQAKALYEKLGFRPVEYFSIKNKNTYNESLFIGPELEQTLNPYAQIIVDEARARGIHVEVLDADEGYIRLSRGSTNIVCRESLSELTTAIAMSRCQDKYVTHRWLRDANVRTPAYRLAGDDAENTAFLDEHKRIVVKPCDGEQGKGITVDVREPEAMREAIEQARQHCERVLLESFHAGVDLRIVVINYEVVAAAVRIPPAVIGDGTLSVRELIEKLSRRRQAATDGESRIDIDQETERCVAEAGYDLNSVLPVGTLVTVRKTANLHTGGTIEDVTAKLHPRLEEVAVRAATRLDIPVVGFDLIVPDPAAPDYVFIEANERVGLANHEPQPTAERFVDLLFPLSAHDRRKNLSENSQDKPR